MDLFKSTTERKMHPFPMPYRVDTKEGRASVIAIKSYDQYKIGGYYPHTSIEFLCVMDGDGTIKIMNAESVTFDRQVLLEASNFYNPSK